MLRPFVLHLHYSRAPRGTQEWRTFVETFGRATYQVTNNELILDPIQELQCLRGSMLATFTGDMFLQDRINYRRTDPPLTVHVAVGFSELSETFPALQYPNTYVRQAGLHLLPWFVAAPSDGEVIFRCLVGYLEPEEAPATLPWQGSIWHTGGWDEHLYQLTANYNMMPAITHQFHGAVFFLRVIFKTVLLMVKWNKGALERLYAPGGSGFQEAALRFQNNKRKGQ